jgi:hypothetical protein
MIPDLRKKFNDTFSDETYRRFLEELKAPYPGAIDFRIAETPLFVPARCKNQMLSVCEKIVDGICSPTFLRQSSGAVPVDWHVPGEEANPHWLMFDFAVCKDAEGEWIPQLIELQGFPTIYAFKVWHDEMIRRHFHIPDGFSCYLNGFNSTDYLALIRKMIIGDNKPESVILLDIFPDRQGTRVDFYCFRNYLDIPVVCLTELEREGRYLFYRRNGRRIRIERIFNRVIFDELQQHSPEVVAKGKLLMEEIDVDWITHPNWFYRISKHTLPFLDQHPFIPETRFLSDLNQMPKNLEDYVLKPLFSFAGHGVIIDPTPQDLSGIKDPQNWIIQRKVKYADALLAPDGPVKAEVRIIYFWEEGTPRPKAVSNLVRLSKGQMIGLRFNKGKSWVGSSLAYFEP